MIKGLEGKAYVETLKELGLFCLEENEGKGVGRQEKDRLTVFKYLRRKAGKKRETGCSVEGKDRKATSL